MTELAERYRIFSGLLFINIDEQIASCKKEDLPYLYRKLVWNLKKGTRLTLESKQGQDFAWIVCNLAAKCSIDVNAKDIIPDNVLSYDDFITHYELNFAHKIITDCEHLDQIISYLIGENSDEVGFILEEGDGRIIIEK